MDFFEREVLALCHARSAVKDMLDYVSARCVLNERHRYELQLVLTELTVNGFMHGGGDRQPVRIAMQLRGSSVVVCVRDGGCGPSDDALRRAYNVCDESGRGLMLVRELCSRVTMDRGRGCIVVRMDL